MSFMLDPSEDITKLLKRLNTDLKVGLTSVEASYRLDKFGLNAIITEIGKSYFRIIVEQFNNLMVYLLFFAAIASFWFEEYLDCIAILLVILINGLIGFWMELQAQKSMNALRKLTSVSAKVLRDGSLKSIPSEMLVPGDVLYIEAGDMITADARVILPVQLEVNESSLTGEALPVRKKEIVLDKDTMLSDRINILYKGTYVTKGNAQGIVISTGMQTELGKIAGLIQEAKQSVTPLEKKLDVFSRKLIYITIGLMTLVFLVGLLTQLNYMQLLQTTIALAVAAIPEGLPIVATLALARGVLKMAKKNVIVKKLSAVEALGGTTVICTDKTGTLTQNKIEVTDLVLANGPSQENERISLNIAVLCNKASIQINEEGITEIGDPLETGLLKFAHKKGVSLDVLRSEFPIIDEEPFSSESKMMLTLHQDVNHPHQYYLYAKGATEEILNKCSRIISKDGVNVLDENRRTEILKQSELLASKGSRVISGAFKDSSENIISEANDLIFVGIYGMMDPPGIGVQEAIKECKQAGIQVVMITGDHPSTARFIANQLNIASKLDHVIVGKDMRSYVELDDHEREDWSKTHVFARVTPEHKIDLVKVLQDQGHIVGMTGDGVNDAPALKKADIGIAMGQRGTQVAQEAADMILKDDSFSSIVDAVQQGRIIFGNIQKFVIYLLSCNLSELFIVSIAALFNLHFQLFPLQILFINLVTDVLPALALGMGGGSSRIMEQDPRNPSDPILNRKQWYAIWVYAVVISSCTLGAVFVSHQFFHEGGRFSWSSCNNILFFSLIFCQLIHVFNMATKSISFLNNDVTRNKYVWIALLASLLTICVLFFIAPIKKALHINELHIEDVIVAMIAAVISLIVIQILKKLKIIRDE